MMSTLRTLKVFALTSLLLISFTFVSCSKKVRFQGSNVVPAAEGYSKISKDDNRNYIVEVHISNLAGSDRLQPPKNAYVVWISTEDNGVKNLGQFKSSTSFFSKSLEGTLKGTTPFKPTQVFVTAEDAPNVEYPGPYRILQTGAF